MYEKSYSTTFNAQLLLELLKETKTTTQFATEHGVHPNVLRACRDQAIKELPI